ncbi:MAG: hypothetical protein FJ298_04470 [Planctomycetes bacterium]|nr:hypothetical protein [Planctomycetota bacterium]
MATKPAVDPQQFQRALLEILHALVLLAPAAFLVWPGALSPIADDPFPIPTGTGVAGVAGTLAIALLITRRAKPLVRGVWTYLAFLALGYVSQCMRPPSDTFGASRALMLAAVCVTALAGGASLSRAGLSALARGLVLLSMLAVVPALFDSESQFSGRLGNSGSTSEVALLGAATGLWLALRERDLWRWIGALAAGLYSFYVGVAPVLAGAASFALVLALLVIALPDTRRLALLLGASCALLMVGGRVVPHPRLPASARPAEHAPGDSGGIAVRRLLWSSLPSMVQAHGLLGIGPGQFQSAYPPFRDPREIELSTHERTLPQAETEVEHAHSDLLQGCVEAGWLGGALWLAFFGFVARASWQRLRDRGDDLRAPLAAAALAVLLNALWREPLLWNPASASAAFALFGALLAIDEPRSTTRSRVLRSAFVLLSIGLVASQLARAWSIAWHGRALAQFASSGNPAFAQLALEVCEDSPVARAVAARRADEMSEGKPSEESVEAWQAVLEVRPHNVEALIQLATAQARTGREARALETLAHVNELDSRHPIARRNLVRMHALFGDLAQARTLAAELGSDSAETWRSLGGIALQELRVARGLELFALVDARFAGLGADRAYALARSGESGLDESGRLALEGTAHLLWAREHGEAGRFEDALRSYRQAKRCLAPRDGSDPPTGLALEVAGSLAALGRVDEARKELGSRTHSASALARMPEWAGQALFENGLLGR